MAPTHPAAVLLAAAGSSGPITPGWVEILTVVAAVGSGLVAGTFFAFTGFVMPALARLPAAQGIVAMQSVNVTAVRPPLMSALFGTAAVWVVVLVLVLVEGGGARTAVVLGGAACYLLGAVGVTAARNVPLNTTLDALDPVASDSGPAWSGYLRSWTRWNTLRAVAAAVSTCAAAYAPLAAG